MLIAGGDSKRKRPLKTKRDVWKCTSLIPNFSLNVAVIGKAGVGKSSFINAIRGFDADDDRTTDVADGAITADNTSYPHPSNSNVNFCKLPDIGTDRFPRQKYLDDKYHIFLLMTDVTESQGHQPDELTSLGNEYHKQKKKFFFVRTKIGVEISNKMATTQDEKAVMREITESTQKHLRNNGWEGVQAFVIDSNEPNKFGFPQLKKCLIEVVSKEMIQLKVAKIRSKDRHPHKVAASTTAKAATSGDAKIDFGGEAESYCKQLGLDEASLKSYAERTSTIYEDLKSIVGRVDEETCKKYVDEQSFGAFSVVSACVSYIPWIGRMFARFGETYGTLHLVLEKLESAALEVVEFTIRQSDE